MTNNKTSNQGNNNNQQSGKIANHKAIPFKPLNAEDQLALDIAKAFEDENHIPMYRSLISKFDKTAIKRAFDEAQAIPESKIKKSRTALFIYLVKKYGNTKNKNTKS